MVRRLLWVLGGIAMVLAPLTSESARVKIGFLVKMPEESWFQTEWKFASQAGRDLGFDVIKIGATDGEKVLAAIDSLAVQGAQGFVICAPNVRLGPAIAERAQAHKMKVIAVDDQLLGIDGTPLRSIPYLGISAREIGMAAASVAAAEQDSRGWSRAETGVIALSFMELETARARWAGTTTFLDAVGFPPHHIFNAPQKTTDVEGGFNAAAAVILKHPEIRRWLVLGIND
jgi:L-arabinose transport system substrate-binding protein